MCSREFWNRQVLNSLLLSIIRAHNYSIGVLLLKMFFIPTLCSHRKQDINNLKDESGYKMHIAGYNQYYGFKTSSNLRV